MNKFIIAVKNLDLPKVEKLLTAEPKWLTWAEDDGKNALHYLCGVVIAKHPDKEADSLRMLQVLLNSGMDIDAVHRIKDENCGFFPARPLWYAYTRGRNKTLYTWLLMNGANPHNCMFAIVWYDDAEAAALFKSHGADIDDSSIGETPLLAAFNWKRFAVAEWLLANGANPNAADKQGNTALHHAVKKKYPLPQIELLLRYGANPNLTNQAGVSPMMLAERQRPQAILPVLTRDVS